MNYIVFKNVLNILSLIALLIIDSLLTNVDFFYVALALFGSMTGSWLLEFFYPSKTFISGLKRTLASTAASIFAGWAATTYFQMVTPAYIGLLFMMLGVSILTTLRTILAFWRNNAKSILIAIVKTKFNLDTVHGKKTVEKTEIKVSNTNENKEEQ